MYVVRRMGEAAIFVATLPFIVVAFYYFELVSRIVSYRNDRARFDRNVANFSRFCAWLLRVVFRADVTVEGELPELTGRGPFIVVANHQPPLDLLLVPYLFQENWVSFVTRKGLDGRGLRALPAVTHYLKASQSIFVRRGDREGNLALVKGLAERAKVSGRGIAIFPQGVTRWGEGRSNERLQRSGLRTLLDQLEDAMVIPIRFENLDKFLAARAAVPRFGLSLKVKVHPPITRSPGDTESLIDACERIIVGPTSMASSAASISRGSALGAGAASSVAMGSPTPAPARRISNAG